MSFTYLLIGFGINKKNAKYLLAGYNTMSKEKREKFDIDTYLKFLKPFFKKLSIFPPVTFLLLSFLLEGGELEWVWALLQLIPFCYFLEEVSDTGKKND